MQRNSASDIRHLQALARLIRFHCLNMTSRAHSGHLTSSLSATDLMTALVFGGTFRFKLDDPAHPNNDRLIFSKGHASPLFYALWAVAGALSEDELMTYRHFGSRLEGHPTPRLPYVEAATGSLGQGLGIGLGMALNASRLDRLPYRTYVLLGDSEMTEGSQWEAIQLAAYYHASNLVGIIDVNRLGQRGETMFGHDIGAYARRLAAFGWKTIEIDGHDMAQALQGRRSEAEQVAAALARVSGELAATLDPAQVADRVVATVRSLFGVRRTVVFRLHPASGDLVCIAAAGGDDATWLGQALPAGAGVDDDADDGVAKSVHNRRIGRGARVAAGEV